MPETTTTINRDQRDGLYEVIRNHLALVQDFWVAMERTKDGAMAERLGLEFGEDFRLLQDIGWGEKDERETFDLTMPEHDLMELLQRLQGEAVNVLGLRRRCPCVAPGDRRRVARGSRAGEQPRRVCPAVARGRAGRPLRRSSLAAIGCAITDLIAVANIDKPNFDEPREREGFRARRARIGHQLGTERIGISLWELPPGQKAYPYHFHLAEEEVLIVLAGTPSLRTPAGSQTLSAGDVIRFPTGEQGAHQVWNEDEELVRLLAVSTHGTPDVVIYPDSNKLSAAERLPESDGRKHYFRIEDEVEYWEGEQA